MISKNALHIAVAGIMGSVIGMSNIVYFVVNLAHGITTYPTNLMVVDVAYVVGNSLHMMSANFSKNGLSVSDIPPKPPA